MLKSAVTAGIALLKESKSVCELSSSMAILAVTALLTLSWLVYRECLILCLCLCLQLFQN